MMTPKQLFDIGYHLNTWDLSGQMDTAFQTLSEAGIKWYEPLVKDSMSDDFCRRYITQRSVALPPRHSDVYMLERIAAFSNAELDHDMKLAGLYVNAEMLRPNLWPHEWAVIQATVRLLRAYGSDLLIMGGGPAARFRPHAPEEYRAFADKLEAIGAYTARLGIRTVYHPHMDCFIETREQLDRLMDILDTSLVGLCVDPAHLLLCGSDPVDILDTYIAHVGHVHFKDCRGDLAALQGADRYRAFCELGDGHVDLAGMTRVLLKHGYDKLVILELDATDKPARDSCQDNVRYVTETLGLQLNVK
ncbi:TIM barrel protein [Paenibacillus sp. IB182496]|uniref:TIM barrel protein n=1 Tax=Paenibacillus sabuli TaxID=2772509 RepID=A0A927BV11_9BACL|nr:sugar phosphate isomerase/epimerase [Paenibacillus sabuli]MBD2846847.1 TIM barrel protein [Paenibacillus sabuli]